MKIRLYIGLTVLAIGGFIVGLAWIIRPKPVSIAMDTPVAIEAQTLVKRMYFLEGNITCVPGTTVAVLAKVMADSPDYCSTSQDKKRIEKVFDEQALTHAGLLI